MSEHPEERDEDMKKEESEEEEEVPIKVFALDLLILVKSAQNQNGLRANDYLRYHKYCQRKMYR